MGIKKLITYNIGKVLSLSRRGSPITPSDLAQGLGYGFHEAYEVLSDMESKGLVEISGRKLVKGPGWTVTENGELRNLIMGRAEMSYRPTERSRRENRSVIESIFG